MKTCPDCGQPEQRQKDATGRWLLNLDPYTGKCLKCLCKSVKAKGMPSPRVERDWARLAAGERDED